MTDPIYSPAEAILPAEQETELEDPRVETLTVTAEYTGMRLKFQNEGLV